VKWFLSFRADQRARVVADRHYNRQKVGSKQFVPPGGCLVLATENYAALWVTSTPFAEYVKHAWPGAWVNSLFRNEGKCVHCGLPDHAAATVPCWRPSGEHEFVAETVSSQLITDAVAASCAVLGPPPPLGIVSFVDASQVKRKRDPGRCYRKAGWRHAGFTKAGLWVFQQLPGEMPAPSPPLTRQMGFAA
jgi:hypothetical protein